MLSILSCSVLSCPVLSSPVCSFPGTLLMVCADGISSGSSGPNSAKRREAGVCVCVCLCVCGGVSGSSVKAVSCSQQQTPPTLIHWETCPSAPKHPPGRVKEMMLTSMTLNWGTTSYLCRPCHWTASCSYADNHFNAAPVLTSTYILCDVCNVMFLVP